MTCRGGSTDFPLRFSCDGLIISLELVVESHEWGWVWIWGEIRGKRVDLCYQEGIGTLCTRFWTVTYGF